jgi:uncharacterized membrane protein YhaH (DUF805 family)
MDTYISVWKKSFNFADRAQRKEYWIFALINLIVIVVLSIIGRMISSDPESMAGSVLVLGYALACMIPSIAVAVRRMHDTGRSGWWLLINFVPFIGGIWFFVLTVLDSKPETNQWGPSTKYSGQTVV